MKQLTAISIALTALVLTSCSDEAELPETDNVTETTMDEVDVIDGTINDEMTDVDAEKSSDGLADEEESQDNEAETGSETTADVSE